MATWIALFRGINVGGKNVLPIAGLRKELEGLGLEDVRTYIQSGNVVFRSGARSAARLADTIEPATPGLGTRTREHVAKWTQADRSGQVRITRALTTPSLEVQCDWTRT